MQSVSHALDTLTGSQGQQKDERKLFFVCVKVLGVNCTIVMKPLIDNTENLGLITQFSGSSHTLL